jgi:hypothetical protein
MSIKYSVWLCVLLMGASQLAYAEGDKLNVELTGYLPGLGMEYQWNEDNTIGINYSAPFQTVNVNITNYQEGALNGGFYMNAFLGYGEDNGDKTGIDLGRYLYTGGVAGYQWMLKSGINFNVDAGLMFVVFLDALAAGETRILPVPAFAASVGYAFSLGN